MTDFKAHPLPTERHPLTPFLPEGTKLLMLGSFPPPLSRWCMHFFYPNYINDMWRIFGLIFRGDRDALVDTEKRTFRLAEIKQLLCERPGCLFLCPGRVFFRARGLFFRAGRRRA